MASTDQMEAIKLIGEWSKWVVAVETAAIASIGVLAKTGGLIKNLGYAMSICLFVISIACASAALISLPASIQDIGPTDKVWDRPCAIGMWHPPLYGVVGAQFILFLVGILFYAVTVIFTLFWSGQAVLHFSWK